uniref:Uncharacterized protein n=1 Tax=Physcomitrium patens TaxID=3218 RepID=A0A7I4FN69_PHYPA
MEEVPIEHAPDESSSRTLLDSRSAQHDIFYAYDPKFGFPDTNQSRVRAGLEISKLEVGRGHSAEEGLGGRIHSCTS